MSNSPLVVYQSWSPFHSGPRNHKIDTITIHCMAGNLSVETCGNIFQAPGRNSSSNYGISSDGRIGQYVDEANRSWCTSSPSNDNRAITIEVANNGKAPDWPVSKAAYEALIALVTDICQRNGIQKLLWKGDKSLIGQVDKQNMTVHCWYVNKSCPGNYLYNRHGDIARRVNINLGVEEEEEEMTQEQFNTMMNIYLKDLSIKAPNAWSAPARAWAEQNGIIAGDATGNKQYGNFCTREQIIQFLYILTQKRQ